VVLVEVDAEVLVVDLPKDLEVNVYAQIVVIGRFINWEFLAILKNVRNVKLL
jgi:hypothetical protein